MNLKSDSNSCDINLQLPNEIREACDKNSLSEEWTHKISAFLQQALKENEVQNTNSKATNSFSSAEKYRHLMIALVRQEMSDAQINGFSGDLSEISTKILSLYALSKSLNDLHVAHAQWSAYAECYNSTQFNLSIFRKLLAKVTQKNEKFKIFSSPSAKEKVVKKILIAVDGEIEASFREGRRLLFEKFARTINDLLWDEPDDEKATMLKMNTIKETLNVIQQIEEITIDGEIQFSEILGRQLSIVIQESLTLSCLESIESEACFNSLISLVNNTTSKIKQISDENEESFESYLKFPLSESLHSINSEMFDKRMKPVVSGKLEKLSRNDKAPIVIAAMKLYKELGNFSNHLKHTDWFPESFAVFTDASTRIERATKFDRIPEELPDAIFTSSALDTRNLIHANVEFWKQFALPAERQTDFAKFVTGEISDLALLYIDKYSAKTLAAEDSIQLLLQTSNAIANFNYMSHELQEILVTLLKGLKFDTLNSCANIINSTFRTIEKKVTDLISISLEKLGLGLKTLLISKAESDDGKGELLSEFGEIRSSFSVKLKKVQLQAAQKSLWAEIIKVLPEVEREAIETKASQEFFINLNEIWISLKEIFQLQIENPKDQKKVDKFEHFLELYSSNPSQLVCRHYASQKQSTPHAAIAKIACSFTENKLKVHIRSAHNFNSSVTDFFVRVRLIRDESFVSLPFKETKPYKIEKNNYGQNYSLIDEEILEFELTERQKRQCDAAVFFQLKGKTRVTLFQTLGEAFITFEDIHKSNTMQKQKDIEIHFVKMICDDGVHMKVLKHRRDSNDTVTKKILAKMERRQSSTT